MWKARLLFSILLAAVVMQGRASVVIPIDVVTQADEADLIFIGTVIGTESVPVKDGTFAYTYVTFHVEEMLKGASGPTLALRVAGGQVGLRAFGVDGAPKFETGGRHVLFVKDNDVHPIPLLGGPQGKLNFVRHPVTQEEILTDDKGLVIDGLRENNWARSGLSVDRGGQLQRPERVAEVLSQEGVTVVLDQPDPDTEATPAARVIAELRKLIRTRAFAPEFKRSQAVRSASPANVPATDR
jgi:hypothetical protein